MLESIILYRQILIILLRKSPSEMVFIIAISLLSKISSLLALFLPIKIILLIGHDKIPSYFPIALASIEKNSLIIWLCVLTIILYVLHVMFEVLIERFEKSGTTKLVNTLADVKISKRDKANVQKIFRMVSKSFAELVFSLSIMFYLVFIHPPLFVLILVYSTMVLGWHMAIVKKQPIEEPIQGEHYEQDNGRKKIWFDIGFLLAFVFIVWELMSDSSLSVITAFISFLLLRQSSAGLKRLTNDMSFLKRQRDVVETIKNQSKMNE